MPADLRSRLPVRVQFAILDAIEAGKQAHEQASARVRQLIERVEDLYERARDAVEADPEILVAGAAAVQLALAGAMQLHDAYTTARDRAYRNRIKRGYA